MLDFVRLVERVEVTMGRQRSPKHQVGAHMIPYLRAANVKDGALDLSSVLAMNFGPSEQLKYCLVRGDVLVTEGCGSLAQIGASARWDGQLEGPVGFQNTVLRLRAIDGISDAEFVYQWARWSFESGAFARTATGSSIFHIGATRASRMPFPDMPVEAQRRIGDLMQHFDRALALSPTDALRSLRSGVLDALVTGAHEIPFSYDRFVPENSSYREPDAVTV